MPFPFVPTVRRAVGAPRVDPRPALARIASRVPDSPHGFESSLEMAPRRLPFSPCPILPARVASRARSPPVERMCGPERPIPLHAGEGSVERAVISLRPVPKGRLRRWPRPAAAVTAQGATTRRFASHVPSRRREREPDRGHPFAAGLEVGSRFFSTRILGIVDRRGEDADAPRANRHPSPVRWVRASSKTDQENVGPCVHSRDSRARLLR